MKVLVDTSVWSLALRRVKASHVSAQELGRLVSDGQVAMIGPIRQELLSGISRSALYEDLKTRLEAFEDLNLERAHFETAADFHNRCRRQGVQGSHTDFLICAVAHLEKMPIFSTDQDFSRFAKHLPIVLYTPRN